MTIPTQAFFIRNCLDDKWLMCFKVLNAHNSPDILLFGGILMTEGINVGVVGGSWRSIKIWPNIDFELLVSDPLRMDVGVIADNLGRNIRV